MLEIRNLYANIDDTEILKGISLDVKPGELHAIMGPNGSGKSTLANVLAGRPSYEVKAGEILLDNQDLISMLPEERARAGLFLCFQHPVEVPGVRMDQFLRQGFNDIRKSKGEDQIDVLKFDKMLKEKVGIVGIDYSFIKRSVNEGFSGGEKKRNEILQMAVLEPKLAILDEPDSGLDVDALRQVAGAINNLRTDKNAVILVTHYQRILDYVVPDKVHIFVNGRIVKSGDKNLALEIESEGYDKYEERADKGASA